MPGRGETTITSSALLICAGGEIGLGISESSVWTFTLLGGASTLKQME